MKARLFCGRVGGARLGCAARRFFRDVATDHPGPCARERPDIGRPAGIHRRGTLPRPRQGRHRPRHAGGRPRGNPLPCLVVGCVLAPKRGPGGWGDVRSEEAAGEGVGCGQARGGERASGERAVRALVPLNAQWGFGRSTVGVSGYTIGRAGLSKRSIGFFADGREVEARSGWGCGRAGASWCLTTACKLSL